jgi:multidrug efflux pump subunit AcrB
MLTGTLVTCAGFIPMGFSKGMAAEFTSALFPVISIALLLSWLVSVTATPLIGYHIMRSRPRNRPAQELYSGRFYTLFRGLLAFFLLHRKLVLLLTLLSFGAAVFLLRFVKQDFFPASLRPEIIVQMTLPAGSSMKATAEEARRFAAFLDEESGIKNYTYYVGESPPRFLLTVEPVLPASNYAQFVIVAEDVESRLRLQTRVEEVLNEKFPQVVGNIRLIQTGPPSPYPVMLRVSGYDRVKVRELAAKIAGLMRLEPYIYNVNFDWNEFGKAIRLQLDNDKIQALGLDRQTLATYLQTQISGLSAAEFYEKDRTIGIVLRMNPEDRDYLGRLEQLPVFLPGGRYVQLGQITVAGVFEAEESVIWRRNLKPTITVQANISAGTATDLTRRIYDRTEELRAGLPSGYSIEMDGAAENSATAINHMLVPVPWMAVTIITILALQLQRFSLVFLALCIAPLGLIGVTAGMLAFGQPMGFVAQLGILALSGMIIRNSVILIVQIETHLARGENPWTAIVESAVFRFRPIMLTAATSILAMVPLMRSVFWGPMAVAIASGLLLATVLTLLVLPCMYAFAFRVKTPERSADVADGDGN